MREVVTDPYWATMTGFAYIAWHFVFPSLFVALVLAYLFEPRGRRRDRSA